MGKFFNGTYNKQNQTFEETSQNVCLYIHVVVLLRYWPSLDGKFKRFVTINGEAVAKIESDRF